MSGQGGGHDIYMEEGRKKVFAGAIDWPGWCRFGRDPAMAIAALVHAAPRYARVLEGAKLRFQSPSSTEECVIVERLEGNSTTDFGAPAIAPSIDSDPLSDPEKERLRTILHHCWLAFHQAVHLGQGQTLEKGPRGGGRELVQIEDHVVEGHMAYLRKLGWKAAVDMSSALAEKIVVLEQADHAGIDAWAAGELPTEGPRGGSRWTARYFVRRAAWHLLDHAWEIEDRAD
ncbi:MAG: hypothetical protein WBR18_08440 [Anaerolineales bacterium]